MLERWDSGAVARVAAVQGLKASREQVMQTILHERGYVVIWQPMGVHRYEVGDIIGEVGEGLSVGVLLQVAKRATRKEFLEQQRLSMKLAPELWKGVTLTSYFKHQMFHANGGVVYWKLIPAQGSGTRGRDL